MVLWYAEEDKGDVYVCTGTSVSMGRKEGERKRERERRKDEWKERRKRKGERGREERKRKEGRNNQRTDIRLSQLLHVFRLLSYQTATK